MTEFIVQRNLVEPILDYKGFRSGGFRKGAPIPMKYTPLWELQDAVVKTGLIECHRNNNEILRLNAFNLYITPKPRENLEEENNYELYAINPCLCGSLTDYQRINNTHYNFNKEKDKRYIMELPNEEGVIEFWGLRKYYRGIPPIKPKYKHCVFVLPLLPTEPETFSYVHLIIKHFRQYRRMEDMPYHFHFGNNLTKQQLKENKEFLIHYNDNQNYNTYNILIDVDNDYSSKEYLSNILEDNYALAYYLAKKR